MAASRLEAADRVTLLMAFVPYLIDQGAVPVDQLALHFDITPAQVQELVQLDDGSSIKITVARWLTPNGTSISEGGLTPDMVVERTPEDRIAEKDPQLDAALEFLAK